MGGGGGKGGGGSATNYRVSLLLAVCWGPVNAIRAVYYGEKMALGTLANQNRLFNVKESDLHGGTEKEGGFVGGLWFLKGSRYQKLPAYLASKFHNGAGPSKAPGYRDICLLGVTEYATGDDTCPPQTSGLLHYREGQKLEDAGYGGFEGGNAGLSNGLKGASVSYNNPYLKDFWVTVTDLCDHWRPKLSAIYRTAADRASWEGGQGIMDIRGEPDTNLVHVMHEAMTDDSGWGFGIPWWAMDDKSWTRAAQVAYDEGMGGSFLWTQTMQLERFIQMIADHLRAMIFVDPESGLIGIELLRKNYNEATLPIFTPENSRLTDVSTKDPTENVNEIVVEWTNPKTMDTESVYAQDLASIAELGETISETQSYTFFNRQDLAFESARIGVRTRTAPVRSGVLEVQPQNRKFKPGNVVRIQYPLEGLPDAVCRVLKVELGKPTPSAQTLHWIEDVLAEASGSGGGTPGDRDEYLPLPPTDVAFFTVPYFLARRVLADWDDGEEFMGALVAVGQTGAYGAAIFDNVQNNTGTWVKRRIMEAAVSRMGVIPNGLSAEAQSNMVMITLLGAGLGITEGDYVLIGPNENDAELCVMTQTPDGTYYLRRGILDTVPKAWPNGTPCWIIPAAASLIDNRARAPGERPNYRIRTVTINGQLPETQEVSRSPTVIRRADRPNRPANVRVDGVPFAGMNAPFPVSRTGFTISWATRNRRNEDSVILGWGEASIPPEPGQTTTVVIESMDGNTVVTQIAGITDTSRTFTLPSSVSGQRRVRIFSVRNGVKSLREVQLVIQVN